MKISRKFLAVSLSGLICFSCSPLSTNVSVKGDVAKKTADVSASVPEATATPHVSAFKSKNIAFLNFDQTNTSTQEDKPLITFQNKNGSGITYFGSWNGQHFSYKQALMWSYDAKANLRVFFNAQNKIQKIVNEDSGYFMLFSYPQSSFTNKEEIEV